MASSAESVSRAGGGAVVRRVLRRGSWRSDASIGRPRGGASLLSQVLAVNTLIIVATVFTASVAAQLEVDTPEG